MYNLYVYNISIFYVYNILDTYNAHIHTYIYTYIQTYIGMHLSIYVYIHLYIHLRVSADRREYGRDDKPCVPWASSVHTLDSTLSLSSCESNVLQRASPSGVAIAAEANLASTALSSDERRRDAFPAGLDREGGDGRERELSRPSCASVIICVSDRDLCK